METVPPTPRSELPHVIQRQEVSQVLLAAFTALGYALSARALLFIALVGAFALAVMAMLNQTVMSAVVLGIYMLLVILPMVYLELRAKRSD